MTIRELCPGDILAVDTYESGELIAQVRHIHIGPHSSSVTVALADGRTRTVLADTDADAFTFATTDQARTYRTETDQ